MKALFIIISFLTLVVLLISWSMPNISAAPLCWLALFINFVYGIVSFFIARRKFSLLMKED